MLRPDVNKKKIALPNMSEVQMMFDTLMNPVALKESTATVDLSILQFIFISYISANFTSAKLC